MNQKISKSLIAVILIILIGGAIFYFKFYKKEPEPSGCDTTMVEGDPVLGDSNAPVTIIEYTDFQCPYCANFSNFTFFEIKKEYIDKGKVKIIFKNFPLPSHKNAEIAAEAGDCAFEQGKFWEYEEVLFKNQKTLSKNDLKKYAQDLGLDIQKFNCCLDSNKYEKKVKDDFEEGQKGGVNGTPSFFINGQILVGAQPFSEFQKIIEEKLK